MRGAKPFLAPKVTVAAVTPGESFDTIAITESLDPYTPPLAPAGLYDLTTEREEAAQLHKLVSSDSVRYTFRTFPPQRISPAVVGKRLVYRSWWTPHQLELITDTSLGWRRRRYPADDDHIHCALTWEAITAQMEAYQCNRDWITIEAYEKFIRDDIFHCREV